MNNKTLALESYNHINKYLKSGDKIGVNDMSYQMTIDNIKSKCSDDIEATSIISELVTMLRDNKQFKVSRIMFDNKEAYIKNFNEFQEAQAKLGIIVKVKNATNRFLLVDENTSLAYPVSKNIGNQPVTIPKEIVRYEMETGEKGSKKKALKRLQGK